MAKVSRSVLKEIVKECLVEILSEGLLNSAETINESKTRKKRRKQNQVEPDVFQKRNKMLQEKTSVKKPDVSSLTDDPLMQEIFADTASTTFQSQPLSESSMGRRDYQPHDAAAQAVNSSDLEDLFDNVGNWASLAFSDAKK